MKKKRPSGWHLATPENLNLSKDDSQQWGGWPEGEYDPPVSKQIIDYFKAMGIMKEETNTTLVESPNSTLLRSYIREILQVNEQVVGYTPPGKKPASAYMSAGSYSEDASNVGSAEESQDLIVCPHYPSALII